MIHAIFYNHQTSGLCAGMCMCDRMHQMEKFRFRFNFSNLDSKTTQHIFVTLHSQQVYFYCKL